MRRGERGGRLPAVLRPSLSMGWGGRLQARRSAEPSVRCGGFRGVPWFRICAWLVDEVVPVPSVTHRPGPQEAASGPRDSVWGQQRGQRGLEEIRASDHPQGPHAGPPPSDAGTWGLITPLIFCEGHSLCLLLWGHEECDAGILTARLPVPDPGDPEGRSLEPQAVGGAACPAPVSPLPKEHAQYWRRPLPCPPLLPQGLGTWILPQSWGRAGWGWGTYF